MSYPEFQTIVRALAKVCGEPVVFHHDIKKGRYFAFLPNDKSIMTRPTATKATVRYGRHHMFQIPLADLRAAV